PPRRRRRPRRGGGSIVSGVRRGLLAGAGQRRLDGRRQAARVARHLERRAVDRAAVGLRLTVMLQDFPAARTVPMHAWPAGIVEAPVATQAIAGLVTLNAIVAEVRTRTVSLLVVFTPNVPKVTGFGETTKVEPAPVPESGTWVFVPTSLGISNVAVRDPIAVGLNVTLIVQLAPTARCAHVLPAIV